MEAVGQQLISAFTANEANTRCGTRFYLSVAMAELRDKALSFLMRVRTTLDAAMRPDLFMTLEA